MDNKRTKIRKIFFGIGMLLLLIYILPYFLLWKNSSFRIDDFLDDEVIQYKLSGKYFFTSYNTKVAEWFGGADKFAIQPPCFILVLFYRFFDFFFATLLSLISGVIFAYTGMFLLLEKALRRTYYCVICIVSVLFSILPFIPSYGLSSIGLPLVIWAFWNLIENQKCVLSYICVIFYALYSSLVWSGYFVLGFAVILVIVLLCIRKKQAAARCMYAVAGMLAVYTVVFRDTIYGMLFSGIISHRNNPDRVYLTTPFWDEFVEYFKYGQYHAPSYHTYIMAASFLLIIVLGVAMIFQKKIRGLKRDYFLIAGLWVCGLLIAAFAGFYNTEAALRVRMKIGILKSLQLDRIYWLNPTLWYLLLALCAKICFDGIRIFVPSKAVNRVAVVVAAVCLAGYMIPYLLSKNDIYMSNLRQIGGKENTYITYKQYYDEELYTDIAHYIGRDKSQYRVGSLGIAPAVASMNGFYTIDAYSTNYSLEYKQRFREIIAKELDKSGELEWYFDSWGNRCYLLSSELGKNWNIYKNDNVSPIDWDVNPEALRDLGCAYIISAVKITNSEDVELELLREFETKNSARRVYLYEVGK